MNTVRAVNPGSSLNSPAVNGGRGLFRPNAAHDGRIPRGGNAISPGRGAGSYSKAAALPPPTAAGAPDEAANLVLSAMRLALLTDIHKARRSHRPTGKLAARLRIVTAQIAAMEG